LKSANHHLSYLVVCVAEFCLTVALHEAGHAVVGRFYGVEAVAYLLMDRGALSGCTEYHGRIFSEHEFRIVALAGSVAVVHWQRPNVTAEQLFEENWTPTPRDAVDAGDFSLADLAECLEIIYSRWAEVEAAAAVLLQDFLGVHKSTASVFDLRALLPADDEGETRSYEEPSS
jgi:hypothetical protein